MPERRPIRRLRRQRLVRVGVAAALFATVLVAAPQPASAHYIYGYVDDAGSTKTIEEGQAAIINVCRNDWFVHFYYDTKAIFDWEMSSFGTSSSTFASLNDIASGSRSGVTVWDGHKQQLYCEYFPIHTYDDNIVEPAEVIRFRLTKFQQKQHPGDKLGTPCCTTITILDNDGHISVSDPSTFEGGDLVFEIRMDNSIVPGGHWVTPTITGGNAEATDYKVTLDPIRFDGTANETRTLTVSTIDDNIVEGGETLTLTVTSDNENISTRTASGTGVISDNDQATLSFSSSAISVDEGYEGTYTLSLGSKPTEHPFTVDVYSAADTGAKKALPDGNNRSWSDIDYFQFSHRIRFEGTANESHSGTTLTNVNVETELVNGEERDHETYRIGASVRESIGQVNAPATPMTVTIVNSDEQNVVLTVGDTWVEEGDANDVVPRYLVIPIYKNHVFWGSDEGKVTVGLDVTDVTTNSADYETDGNGDPVFTCWSRYPSTSVDPDFDATTDEITLPTQINSINVPNEHHCLIDTTTTHSSAFARLKVTGDSVREPADGSARETMTVAMDVKKYHSDTTAPSVVSTDTATLGIANEDYEQLSLTFDPSGNTQVSSKDISENGGTASVRATLNAAAPDDIYVQVSFDPCTDPSVCVVPDSSDINAYSRNLFIPKGQTKSTGTVSVRAVNNAVDVGPDASAKKRFSVRPTAWTPAGVMANVGITLNITDDDQAGYDVYRGGQKLVGTGSPTYLHLHEGGGAATIRYRLQSPPAENVTVTPAISAEQGRDTDFTLTVGSGGSPWTFTPQNWSTWRYLTVKANQDTDGGNGIGRLDFTSSTSDPVYNRRSLVWLREIDDDAGITQGPSAVSLLEISEPNSGTYTLKLDAKPAQNVDITASVRNASTGSNDDTTVSFDPTKCDSTVDNGVLTSKKFVFTPVNWATAQTVRVHACDDANHVSGSVWLTHTVASLDTAYDGWPSNRISTGLRDVRVNVADDDSTLVTLSAWDAATGGDQVNSVSEAGGVTYLRASIPAAIGADTTVQVSAAAQDPATSADFSLSGSTLYIAAGQTTSTGTVYVTGRDNLYDGPDKTMLVTGTSSSSNTVCCPVSGPPPMTLVIADDETAAIAVSDATGLPQIDEGGSGTYKVSLASKPTDSVRVTPTVPDAAAGKVTVAPASLLFTPSNYSTPQTVTVTAVIDDDAADEAQFAISHAAEDAGDDDSGYEDLPSGSRRGPVNVSVRDLSAAAAVSATALKVPEGGASFASYSVVLAAKPANDVTVTASWASTPTRDTDLRFATGSGSSLACPSDSGATDKALTFTASNWFSAQDVTLCAADDTDTTAGTAVLSHAVTSTDTKYSGITVGSVRLTEAENDVAALRLVAAPQDSLADRDEVQVAEGASSTDANDQYKVTVALSKAPTADVTVAASVTGTGFTVNGAPLTFTSTNWSTAQTLNLGSALDADATVNTGALTLTATPSDATNDADWAGVSRTVGLVQVDSDTAGIEVSSRNVYVPEGGTAGYRLRLTSRPSATVRVYPTVTGDPSLSAATYSVSFTTANWNQWQTARMSASHDADAVGGVGVASHRLFSSDDHYHALPTAAADVTLVEADDEDLRVAYSTAELDVPTAGSSTYTAVLTRRPNASVEVRVHPQVGTGVNTDLTADTDTDTTDDQHTLTFGSSNWQTPQTITLSAVDDDDLDSDESTRTFTHTASSTDANFNAAHHHLLTATEVAPAGTPPSVVISPSSMRLVTTGGQSEGYISVSLATAPSQTVTVYLAPLGSAQVTVHPQKLTFTTTNWEQPQIVTVRLVSASTGAASAVGASVVGPEAAAAAAGPATATTAASADDAPLEMQLRTASDDSNYSGLEIDSVPLNEAAQPTSEPPPQPGSNTGTGTSPTGGSSPTAGTTESGSTPASVQRLAGADRYRTASAVAAQYVRAVTQQAGSGTHEVTTAIVASGESFADALAASMLSRSLNAPILLTRPDRLDAATSQAIARLGISSVEIVGGPAAVSEEVKAELQALPGVKQVHRRFGDNRYETAVAAARAAGMPGMLCSTSAATAIVASGTSWADAVIAGPLSYRGRHPVVLTDRDAMPDVSLGYLTDRGIAQVLVVGGEAAVGAAVAQQLADADITVIRIAGDNRNDTAVKLADHLATLSAAAAKARAAAGTSAGAAPETASCFGTSTGAIGLTTGLRYPDALAAAPLLGQIGAPLLLTGADLPAETLAYVAAGKLAPKTGTKPFVVIGGANAVPKSHLDQLAAELTP